MAVIARAKELKNVVLGEVGVLFNLDLTKGLDTLLAKGKVVFDSPDLQDDGWHFFGITGNDTKFVQDIKTFEVRVGVPEFILKRWIVGKEGTISGHFKELDAEIVNLLSGNQAILNYFPTANVELAIHAVDGAAKTLEMANADAAKLIVGNTVIVAATGTHDTSLNSARVTRLGTPGETYTLVYFEESWFTTLPLVTDFVRQPSYSVAQLGTDGLTACQALLFYETYDGVQFIYHFPDCEFTPNVSPTFGGVSEEQRLPFELKIEGTANDEHFDGEMNILGYFYELLERSTT